MPRTSRSRTPASSAPQLRPPDWRLIAIKSQWLAHRLLLPRWESADLELDLFAEVLRRLPRYDPARGDAAAFVRLLINHAASTVLRHRSRRRVAQSVCVDVDSGELACVVDERVPESDRLMLSLDVDRVLSELPVPLRRVAESLKTHSVTAAARSLGCSRSELYRKIAELRCVFTASNLNEYLA